MNTECYDQLKQAAYGKFEARHFLQKKVAVRARTLSSQEAIGDPDSNDYPIQKGKERLMQAEIEGAAGQAFTDCFGHSALDRGCLNHRFSFGKGRYMIAIRMEKVHARALNKD